VQDASSSCPNTWDSDDSLSDPELTNQSSGI
jgi:hypothetical protein